MHGWAVSNSSSKWQPFIHIMDMIYLHIYYHIFPEVWQKNVLLKYNQYIREFVKGWKESVLRKE